MTIAAPPGVPESAYVFISYSRSDTYDRRLATRLGEALRLRKVRYFRDEVSIEVGATWPKEIEVAILQATHFVVILSSESEKSEWVKKEMEIALAQRASRGLTLIGIQRSRSASFPGLSDVHLVQPEVDEEIDTVFRALHLRPLRDDRFATSAQLRSSRPESRLAAELCDRRDVEDAFRESFDEFCRQAPLVPQAHFVLGRDDEQHDSFVDRLTWTYLEPHAQWLSEQLGAPVQTTVARITWPQRWDAKKTREALIANVFDTFWPRYSHQPKAAMTPRQFTTAIVDRPSAVVALVHTISSRRWDNATPRMLDDYLKFWREIGACDKQRHILLFFNVCFDGRSDAATRQSVRDAVERLRERVSRARKQAMPVCLMELTCVRREHVRAWFNEQEDAIFARCKTACAELFADGDCQPMAVVEEALRSVRTEHLQEAS